MAQSFNGTIETQGEFQTVSSLTNITFTSGNIYNIWVGNAAQVKVGNYIAPVLNEKFDFKAGDDDLYIKTNYYTKCQLSILENVAS